MEFLKGKRILIVDDEKPVVVFMKNYFQRRNIDVEIATDGDEALNLFDKRRPDVVFLDLNMEGKNGFEVLKEMKERYASSKVIILTGRRDRESKRRTTILGADGYICKPIVIDEFEKILATFLKKK